MDGREIERNGGKDRKGREEGKDRRERGREGGRERGKIVVEDLVAASGLAM